MKCSIVIPTKNRPLLCLMALESMRMAKRPGDEIVLVDSSDGENVEKMAGVVADCGLVDQHILVPEMKQVEATNHGVRAATGEVIRVFSDDDIVIPEGHVKVLDAMEQHPDIDLLVAGGFKFRTDGKAIGIVSLGEDAKYGRSVDSIFMYGSFGGGQFFRRRLFDQIGYFEDISIYDKEIAMRAVQNGLVVRFIRVMSYVHPLYEHSGVVRKWDVGRQEFDSLVKEYKPKQYMMRWYLYPPVWDGAIV